MGLQLFLNNVLLYIRLVLNLAESGSEASGGLITTTLSMDLCFLIQSLCTH